MLFIGGVDEAGRGPLAGPVTASCVVLKSDYHCSDLNDSKQLSPEDRERLFTEIEAHSIAHSTISVGPRRIERYNIRGATILAMSLAVRRVQTQLTARFGSQAELFILSDGNLTLETILPQESMIRGDEKLKVISAASILAKVTRDKVMRELSKRYPQYGFENHKGYPTPRHREALQTHLPCRVHRRSFAGVKELLSENIF